MKSFVEMVALGRGYRAKDEEDARRWMEENPMEIEDNDIPSMCDTCANECKSSFCMMACIRYIRVGDEDEN